MRCPGCGNDNPDEFIFCLECGTHVSTNTPKPFAVPPEPYWEAQHGLERQHDSMRAIDPVALPRAEPVFLSAPPAPRHASPRLTIVEGPGGVGEIVINRPVTTIGRSHSNDVVLDDTRVSRQHARIIWQNDALIIEDAGSRNGTSINGRMIQSPQVLNDGDQVRIGETVLRVNLGIPPATPMQPNPRPAPGGPRPQPPPSSVPVLFAVPWSPIRCPGCHSIGSMRPMVFGPTAATPAARLAAERGEIVIGGPLADPEGPNAECGSCRVRVRILPAAPE